MDKALVRIRKAADALAAGRDFAEVARTHSLGIHAADGGSWGLISPPGLRGRWAKASQTLFDLGAGQTSDVIEGEDAFFIVRCGRIAGGRDVSFEQAQREIAETLRRQTYERRVQRFVAKLFADAHIERVEPFTLAVIAAASGTTE